MRGLRVGVQQGEGEGLATRLNQPRPNAKKANTGLWVTVGVIGAVLFLLPIVVGLLSLIHI